MQNSPVLIRLFSKSPNQPVGGDLRVSHRTLENKEHEYLLEGFQQGTWVVLIDWTDFYTLGWTCRVTFGLSDRTTGNLRSVMQDLSR